MRLAGKLGLSRRTTVHLAWGVLGACAWAACGDDASSAPSDAGGGQVDAGALRDGSGGGADAALPDGRVPDGSSVPDGGGSVSDGAIRDTGTSFDAGTADAGSSLDAGPEPDARGLPDAGTRDPCDLLPPATDCGSGGTCPAGLTCLSDGCGGTRCLPAGHSCVNDSDCPAASTCTSSPMGNVCVAPGGGCADSRDCPVGFACELGGCMDRRLPCPESTDICPRGWICGDPDMGSAPFCVWIATRCENSDACPFFGFCLDMDGDGTKECSVSSGCKSHVECPGQLCGLDPELFVNRCGDFGVCSTAADCLAGQECRDLWGDGVSVCVPPGGTCTSTGGCVSPAVCGSDLSGAAPACIGTL